MSLKYFFASFCTFLVPYLEFEQEILLNREKPVGGEGLYYWTQKLLIIQIQRGGNEHWQAVRFNIYPENRKKYITLPSLTGPTSHLHSDQTS